MSPTHKIKQLEKIYLLGNKTAQAFLESTVSKVITPNEVSERFRMATVPRWLRILQLFSGMTEDAGSISIRACCLCFVPSFISQNGIKN